MILTREQILGYIKKPRNEDLIVRARDIFASHRLHVQGIGLQEFLAKIEGYENEAQYELRRKLAKPTTVPIVGKETEPFSKVFSAQGFSRYYQFSGNQEKLDIDFRKYLAEDIGDGENLKQWMKRWLDKVNYDSSGVFFIELPVEPTALPEPYITFRSILEIKDYWFKGNSIQYIIFEKELKDNSGKKYTEYRVVDEAFDYIVRKIDGELKVIDELTIKNPFGFVPGRIISNQRDTISNARTSFIWKAIKTCDEYLLDSSIQIITKKLHGFPRFWTRPKSCRKCNGKGSTVSIAEDKITPIPLPCGECNSTGYSIKYDVSDVTIIPQLTEQGQPDNVPAMGYSQPEIETPRQQVEELQRVSKMIHLGIWGDSDTTTTTTKAETATGRMLDVQAIYDKLQIVSENAEEVEKFITDTIGNIRYSGSYNGSVVNYGKKYFVRTADEVEQLYLTAKQGGLPSHLLDAYVEEIIYIRFGNDPMELQRQLRLNTLEPFIHLSDKELKDIEATKEDKLMKVYFTDYIERYERENGSVVIHSEAEIISKLEMYNKEKLLQLGGGAEAGDNL